MAEIIKEINNLIDTKSDYIFHIFNNGKQIYLISYEKSLLTISSENLGYIVQKDDLYEFLIKLNIYKINKFNEIEYIVYCEV